MVQKISSFLCCILVLCLTGCGYAFTGGGSILPSDVKRIYIPLAENNSTEAGFSLILTEALRDRFEQFGVVTVVDQEAEADAILNTRILKVQRGTQSVTSKTDTALQQNTTVTMALELKRREGTMLWRNPRLSVSRAFGSATGAVVTTSADFAGGSLGGADLGGLNEREVARGQEQEALKSLAEQAARTVYDQAVAPDF